MNLIQDELPMYVKKNTSDFASLLSRSRIWYRSILVSSRLVIQASVEVRASYVLSGSPTSIASLILATADRTRKEEIMGKIIIRC